MLIKNTGADTIEISNPVLADCPPTKGAETMLRQSDKITALYCRLSRDDGFPFWYKDGLLQCTHKLVIDSDDFFFALAVAPHAWSLVNSDLLN